MNEQGGKIIGNRTRPFAYTFRATEKERQIIDDKIKQSGLTMTDFIIRAITDKPIIVIDHASEMLAELKRQGNNLNQALKYCYYGEAEQQRILSCAEELKKTYKAIATAVKGG